MPVYEYRCEKCGQESEAIQKFSDAPLVDCEACGAKGTLTKLVSKASFALKGTGWYTTDYKRASSPAPTSKPEVATDAKPATDAKSAAEPKKSGEGGSGT